MQADFSRPSNAEIGEFHASAAAEHDVRRLEVPVDDAVIRFSVNCRYLIVGIMQGPAHHDPHCHGLLRGKYRAFRVHVVEGRAGNIFHLYVGKPVPFTDA